MMKPAASQDSRTARCLFAAASSLLVVLPFLCVRFPPVTDLPQHLAQIRLFFETIGNPSSPYRVQWLTPYSLAYVLLGAAWALFSPAVAGRIALVALGILWTGAVHWLAARRQRPAAAAALASTVFFSHILYWGFLSFVIGWPAFAVWFVLTTRPPSRAPWAEALLFLGGAVLLYVSHALWFAAGVAWFAISSVAFRVPLKTVVIRLAGCAPVLVGVTLWYPRLVAAGFVSRTVWASLPTGRLSFSWLVNAAFGGIRGPTEYVIFGVLVSWIGASLWRNRGQLRDAVDGALLFAAVLFFVGAFLLPDQRSNTIDFAARWFPAGMILLLLAVPPLTISPVLQRAAAVVVLVVLCFVTTSAWTARERLELSGLEDALNALPESARVVGLDYVKLSTITKGRPFMQMFAYAEVLRGAELNFSFAQFAPMPVVYKTRRVVPWQVALEWFAERLERSDLAHFTHAMVNGDAETQTWFQATYSVTPVTQAGRWRLYRVNGTQP
jgi:hypothetical protein